MKIGRINVGTTAFIVGYHAILAVTLPLYLYSGIGSPVLWFGALFLFCASGLAITAGYHRYYSHQTYRAHPIVEFFMLLFGTLSTQGSALRWSYEHRIHHAHVDTDKDPYSIKKGFWYAHILWMFVRSREIDDKVVSDLRRNSWVMFQHKYYALLMVTVNVAFTLLFGWLTGDYFGALVVTWLLRLFFSHHTTWFINSLAHTWGQHTFSKELSAVDNYFICLLTWGEGYHNYHHTFANDYRNGIRWYHYDPTKWTIWTLSKLGLAGNLRRINAVKIERRIILEDRRQLLDAIKDSFSSGREALEGKVSDASDAMLAKLSRIAQSMDEYRTNKRSRTASKARLHQLKQEIRSLRRSLKQDWRNWQRLIRGITVLQRLPA